MRRVRRRSGLIPQLQSPAEDQENCGNRRGLSGLTCAVRLAAKSYPVTVYEKSDRLGGRLSGPVGPGDLLAGAPGAIGGERLCCAPRNGGRFS